MENLVDRERQVCVEAEGETLLSQETELLETADSDVPGKREDSVSTTDIEHVDKSEDTIDRA